MLIVIDSWHSRFKRIIIERLSITNSRLLSKRTIGYLNISLLKLESDCFVAKVNRHSSVPWAIIVGLLTQISQTKTLTNTFGHCLKHSEPVNNVWWSQNVYATSFKSMNLQIITLLVLYKFECGLHSQFF